MRDLQDDRSRTVPPGAVPEAVSRPCGAAPSDPLAPAPSGAGR